MAPIRAPPTMATPEPTPTAPRPPLGEVLRGFLWIGLVSFGGGRTAYFQDELVIRRRWFSDAEFLEAVALSQVLPGPTAGNLAAHLGHRLAGGLGAFLAVMALTVPGGLAILGLAWLYFGGLPAAVVGPIGSGVSAASVGLAIAAMIRLRGGIRGPGAYAIAGVTFLLFGPLHWPIHGVLAAAVPPALALAWWARRGAG